MTVIVKVVHKDAVRRFGFPADASWIELEAKLRSLFSIPALAPFILSYTDEDNDTITLSTDLELKEILSCTQNIKFDLKFSTPGDSSDNEDAENDDAWILEGTAPRAASITTNESDGSGLLDNSGLREKVLQSSQSSTTNQEPQNLEINSRDKNETISTRYTPMLSDDDCDSDKEELPIKKTPQVNLLDDVFFESISPPKPVTPSKSELILDSEPKDIEPKYIEPKDIEPLREDSDDESEDESEDEDMMITEQKERIIINETYTPFTDRRENQPRYQDTPPEVNLEQFQTMIENYHEVIQGNPQLMASVNDTLASVKDTMNQIQRSVPENFNQRRVAQLQDRRRSSSASPIPRDPNDIPGAFPTPWAGRNKNDYEGHREPLYILNYKREGTPEESEKKEESKGQNELADYLEAEYAEQVEKLKDMGYQTNDYAQLLMDYNGDFDRVLGILVPDN